MRFLISTALTLAVGVLADQQRELKPNMVLLPYFDYQQDGNGLPTMKIQAMGGCFKWRSEQPDVVGLNATAMIECVEECRSKVLDLAAMTGNSDRYLNSRPECENEVTVFPTNPMANDRAYIVAIDQLTGDELRAEINIAPLDKLRISTRSRRISVGVLEDIHVAGSDAFGNDFDSLEGLRFSWTIKDSAVMQKVKSAPSSSFIARDDVVVLRGLQTGETRLGVSVKPFPKKTDSKVETDVKVTVVDRVAFSPPQLFVAPLWRFKLGLLHLKEEQAGQTVQTFLPPPLQHFKVHEGDNSSPVATPLLFIKDEQNPDVFVRAISSAAGLHTSVSADDQRIDDHSARSRIQVTLPSATELAVVDLPAKLAGQSDRAILSVLKEERNGDIFPFIKTSGVSTEGLPFLPSGQKVYLVKGRKYALTPRLVGEDSNGRQRPLLTPENIAFDAQCKQESDLVGGSKAKFSACEVVSEVTKVDGQTTVVLLAERLGKGSFTFKISDLEVGAAVASLGDVAAVKSLLTATPAVTRPFEVVNPVSAIEEYRGRIVLPPGEKFRINAMGGSGKYSFRLEAAKLGDNALLVADIQADGTVLAKKPGRVTVYISDANDKSNVGTVDVIVWWLGALNVLPRVPMVAVGSQETAIVRADTAALPSEWASAYGASRLPFTSCRSISSDAVDPCTVASGKYSNCQLPANVRGASASIRVGSSSKTASAEVQMPPDSMSDVSICRMARINGISKGHTGLSASLEAGGVSLLTSPSTDIEVFSPLDAHTKTDHPFTPHANRLPASSVDASTLQTRFKDVLAVAAVGSPLTVSLSEGPAPRFAGAAHKYDIRVLTKDAAGSPVALVSGQQNGSFQVLCLSETPVVEVEAVSTNTWKESVASSKRFFVGCAMPHRLEVQMSDVEVDAEKARLVSVGAVQKDQFFVRCRTEPHIAHAVVYDKLGRVIEAVSSFDPKIEITEVQSGVSAEKSKSHSLTVDVLASPSPCEVDNKAKIVASLAVPSAGWSETDARRIVTGFEGDLANAVNTLVTSSKIVAGIAAANPDTNEISSSLASGWTANGRIHVDATFIVRAQVFPLPCDNFGPQSEAKTVTCTASLPRFDNYALRTLLIGGSGFLNLANRDGANVRGSIIRTDTFSSIASPLTAEAYPSLSASERSALPSRVIDPLVGEKSVSRQMAVSKELAVKLGSKAAQQPIADLVVSLPASGAREQQVAVRDLLLHGGATTVVKFAPINVAALNLELLPIPGASSPANLTHALSQAATNPVPAQIALKQSSSRAHAQEGLVYLVRTVAVDERGHTLPDWVLAALDVKLDVSSSSHSVARALPSASNGELPVGAAGLILPEAFSAWEAAASASGPQWLGFVQGITPGVVTVHAVGVSPLSVAKSGKKFANRLVSQDLTLEIYSPLKVLPEKLVLLPGGHTFQLSVFGGPTAASARAPRQRLESAGPAVILPPGLNDVSLATIKTAEVGSSKVIVEAVEADGSVVASTSVPIEVAAPAAVVVREDENQTAPESQLALGVGKRRRLVASLLTAQGTPFTLSHLLSPSGPQLPGQAIGVSAAAESKCSFSWESNTPNLLMFVVKENSEGFVTLSSTRDSAVVSVFARAAGIARVTLHASCEVNGKRERFSAQAAIPVSPKAPSLTGVSMSPVTETEEDFAVIGNGQVVVKDSTSCNCDPCELLVPVSAQTLLSGLAPAMVSSPSASPVSVIDGDASLVTVEWRASPASSDPHAAVSLTAGPRTGRVSLGAAINNEVEEVAKVRVAAVADVAMAPRGQQSLSALPVGSSLLVDALLKDSTGAKVMNPVILEGIVLSSHPSVVEVVESPECRKYVSAASSPSELAAVGSHAHLQTPFAHPPPTMFMGCFQLAARAPGCAAIQLHVRVPTVRSAISTASNSTAVAVRSKVLTDTFTVCSLTALMPTAAASAQGFMAHVADRIHFRSDVGARNWSATLRVSPAELPVSVRDAICLPVTSIAEQNALASSVSVYRSALLKATLAALDSVTNGKAQVSDRDVQILARKLAASDIVSGSGKSAELLASEVALDATCADASASSTGAFIEFTIAVDVNVSGGALENGFEKFLQELWITVGRDQELSSVVDWRVGVQPALALKQSETLDVSSGSVEDASRVAINGDGSLFALKTGDVTVAINSRAGASATASVHIIPIGAASLQVTPVSQSPSFVRLSIVEGNSAVGLGSSPFREAGMDVACAIDYLALPSLVRSKAFWSPADRSGSVQRATSNAFCDVDVAAELTVEEIARAFDGPVSVPESVAVRVTVTPGLAQSTSAVVSKAVAAQKVAKTVSLPLVPPLLTRISATRTTHALSSQQVVEAQKIRVMAVSHYQEEEIVLEKGSLSASNTLLFNPSRTNTAEFLVWTGGADRHVAVWSSLPASLVSVQVTPLSANSPVSKVAVSVHTPKGKEAFPAVNILGALHLGLVSATGSSVSVAAPTGTLVGSSLPSGVVIRANNILSANFQTVHVLLNYRNPLIEKLSLDSVTGTERATLESQAVAVHADTWRIADSTFHVLLSQQTSSTKPALFEEDVSALLAKLMTAQTEGIFGQFVARFIGLVATLLVWIGLAAVGAFVLYKTLGASILPAGVARGLGLEPAVSARPLRSFNNTRRPLNTPGFMHGSQAAAPSHEAQASDETFLMGNTGALLRTPGPQPRFAPGVSATGNLFGHTAAAAVPGGGLFGRGNAVGATAAPQQQEDGRKSY